MNFNSLPLGSKKRFFEEPIENNCIDDVKIRNKKVKRSPVAIDALYTCISPETLPPDEQALELPIFSQEYACSTDECEGDFENASSSENSLEGNNVFQGCSESYLNSSSLFSRDFISIPCSTYVYSRVCNYTNRLNEKRYFIIDSVYQELIQFLDAIQHNLFLESDDFILMDLFDAIDLFFETYIDTINMTISELQVQNFYNDLNGLKNKLESSIMVGFSIDEEDNTFIPRFG